MQAAGGVGCGGAPYLVLQADACLTYADDQTAVDTCWPGEAAESVNRNVRLPEFTPTSATRRHAGEDL